MTALTLSTDNGVVGTAHNLAAATKKAERLAREQGEVVYIMRDDGQDGYTELKAVSPTFTCDACKGEGRRAKDNGKTFTCVPCGGTGKVK